ncbi:MAG: hypothetical protein FGF50_10505 [Candidatus Brockarchaeota archaeon]|nr:hypothetical protein [Candidatus Brockarchaeota archaeon]
MSMIGALLALGHSLAWLMYILGVIFQTLPLPRKSLRAWGPTLMVDAVIAEFALASVSFVEFLVSKISHMLQIALGSPLNPIASFALIVTELATMDAALVSILALISSVPELAVIAQTVNNLLSPALTIVTSALILWIMLEAIASFFPNLWLTAYALGVVFYAIPFRIGRRLGSYLLSSSIVLTIAIPLMPSLAVSLQSLLGYKLLIQPLQDSLSSLQANPFKIFDVVFILSTVMPRIIAAMVISLIIFPPVFLFMVSAIIRGLASTIGGAASGSIVQSFIIVPARELGGALVD